MPASEARVSVFDAGFLHGVGCFETVRIHGGAPFRFASHMDRLRRSLRILGIEPPRALDRIPGAARGLLDRAGAREALLRITLTASTRAAPGTLALTLRPLAAPPDRVVLHVSEAVRRAPGALSGCKTTSRAAERVALREAESRGAFDAVLLNPAGNVVETTARNVFVVADRGVRTPPASEGALDGITRAAVLDLARSSGISAVEAPVSLEDLRSAEEVFLTGSGVGVLPVAEIAGTRYPIPGAITRSLADGYAALLDRESKW